jgi:hypothetical protein
MAGPSSNDGFPLLFAFHPFSLLCSAPERRPPWLSRAPMPAFVQSSLPLLRCSLLPPAPPLALPCYPTCSLHLHLSADAEHRHGCSPPCRRCSRPGCCGWSPVEPSGPMDACGPAGARAALLRRRFAATAVAPTTDATCFHGQLASSHLERSWDLLWVRPATAQPRQPRPAIADHPAG